MWFSALKKIKNIFRSPTQIPHNYNYHWEFEYGNPEEEFLQSLNEARIFETSNE